MHTYSRVVVVRSSVVAENVYLLAPVLSPTSWHRCHRRLSDAPMVVVLLLVVLVMHSLLSCRIRKWTRSPLTHTHQILQSMCACVHQKKKSHSIFHSRTILLVDWRDLRECGELVAKVKGNKHSTPRGYIMHVVEFAQLGRFLIWRLPAHQSRELNAANGGYI